MKKTLTPKIKKIVAKKPLKLATYKSSIKVLGKIYQAEGESIKDSIQALSVSNAKGMSILTISHGEESQSRILSNIQTMRLFSKAPLVREISLKNIALRFAL